MKLLDRTNLLRNLYGATKLAVFILFHENYVQQLLYTIFFVPFVLNKKIFVIKTNIVCHKNDDERKWRINSN